MYFTLQGKLGLKISDQKQKNVTGAGGWEGIGKEQKTVSFSNAP